MNFVISSLFFTNLWIFLFRNILFLLNLNHKQVVTGEFLFPLVVPEPYEIPLYLLLTFVFSLGIFLLTKFFTKRFELNKHLKLVVLLLLLFLLLVNLGKYPMTGDYSSYPPPALKFENILILVVYLLTLTTVILESALLGKIFNNRYIFHLISFFLILFLLIVTFEPKFPISGHDYSFFLGPIWEVSHGKTIYTQVPSQYGFILILFLAGLYKLGLLNLSYLPVFFWFLYILQFYLVFYLVYKISRSYILAVILMFSLLTVNYFSIDNIPSMLPQGGPLRWLPLILGLVFFLKIKKIDSKLFIFLLAFTSLWVIDAGAYLILGYFLTLFFLFLSKKISLTKSLISGIWFILSLMFILLVINTVHILLGMQPVDIISGFHKVNQYAKQGYSMLPIESKSYFWLVLLFYFASIIYFFKNSLSSKTYNLPTNNLLLFSANFSLFAGIYFIGRSHAHNLFAVAVMAIINFSVLISLILKRSQPIKYKFLVYLLLFIFFIVYPAFMRKDAMAAILTDRYKNYLQGNIFSPLMDEYFAKNYPEELKMIKNYFPEKKIALIQSDETYLLYYANKENIFSTNPQTFVVSKNDVDFAVKAVTAVCPKKAILDCRLVNKCSEANYRMFADPRLFSQPIVLNKIQTDCGIKYIPVFCTTKLCVVEAKKE